MQNNSDHLAGSAGGGVQAGLPTLLEELFAAQEKRLTTPTSQCVGLVLEPVTPTDEYCQEIDMAHHRWKLGGGPVREHDARAVAIELRSRRLS